MKKTISHIIRWCFTELPENTLKANGLTSHKEITISFNHSLQNFCNILQAFPTVSLFKLVYAAIIFAFIIFVVVGSFVSLLLTCGQLIIFLGMMWSQKFSRSQDRVLLFVWNEVSFAWYRFFLQPLSWFRPAQLLSFTRIRSLCWMIGHMGRWLETWCHHSLWQPQTLWWGLAVLF